MVGRGPIIYQILGLPLVLSMLMIFSISMLTRRSSHVSRIVNKLKNYWSEEIHDRLLHF